MTKDQHLHSSKNAGAKPTRALILPQHGNIETRPLFVAQSRETNCSSREESADRPCEYPGPHLRHAILKLRIEEWRGEAEDESCPCSCGNRTDDPGGKFFPGEVDEDRGDQPHSRLAASVCARPTQMPPTITQRATTTRQSCFERPAGEEASA